LTFVYVVVCAILIFTKFPTIVYFLIVSILAAILIVQAMKVIKYIISKN